MSTRSKQSRWGGAAVGFTVIAAWKAMTEIPKLGALGQDRQFAHFELVIFGAIPSCIAAALGYMLVAAWQHFSQKDGRR